MLNGLYVPSVGLSLHSLCSFSVFSESAYNLSDYKTTQGQFLAIYVPGLACSSLSVKY